MRKIFYILFLLLISNIFVYSQSGWNILQNHASYSLETIYFVDQNTGWAVGNTYSPSHGIIIKTTNSGLNWDYVFVDSSRGIFTSLYFADQYTGWVVGGGPILKTTDGGLNWFIQAHELNLFANLIFFINQNTGWCKADSANWLSMILHTTNGGTNWIYQNSGIVEYINSIFFINQYTGWYVGGINAAQGIIKKTTNSGINWLSQVPDTSITSLRAVQFVDVNNGWIVNDDEYHPSKIFKTSNGGTNWYNQNIANIYALYTLYFFDQNTGWAGGMPVVGQENGLIIKTTNGGLNWSEQFNGTQNGQLLFSFSFINSNTGWAVGLNGVILNTTNGGEPIGIKPISNEVPNSFHLYQNYPNPFNPTTKIKYDIPLSRGVSEGRGVLVSIKIYDIIGNEVATLVNESLKPGSYEVEWNGSNFASGVYFYRLIAGDFTVTKKLILLK